MRVYGGDVEIFSNERMKNLEGSMTNLLESRQKRIASLEAILKESQVEKAEMKQELDLLRVKAQSGDSKAGLEAELTKVVKEKCWGCEGKGKLPCSGCRMFELAPLILDIDLSHEVCAHL